MMRTMKRCMALLGLCVLAGAVPASAQVNPGVTYALTSVPTFVINSGDSETLGSIRLTATTTNTIVPGSLDFYLPGVSCDNDQTSGITIANSTGVYNVATGTADADFAAAGTAVVNAPGGCTVTVLVNNAVNPAVGDYLQVDGVRGRIQTFSGTTINANVFASPPNSSLIPPPQTTIVATALQGFVATITQGTQLLCLGGETVQPDVNIVEGFHEAFAQFVTTAAGTPPPTNARHRNGANGNTGFAILVSGVPNGYTKTFPTEVCANGPFGNGTESFGSLGTIAGDCGANSSRLELVSGGAVTGTSDPTVVFKVIYEYACANQFACDTSLETYDIRPNDFGGFTTATPPGLLVAQVEFWPRESSPPPGPLVPPNGGSCATDGGCPDASITAPPSSPRFSDAPQPSPATGLNLVAPCTTNLLFPWVVSNVAQFDTGIAIANTGRDPFGKNGGTAKAEHGTCTLYGFPKGEGTVVTLTTQDVSTGDTYTAVLSQTVFNGFEGYIIAICNFQYGHGFAFLSNNFGTGMPPTVGQGYIALIIPDPRITGARSAIPSSEAADSLSFDSEGNAIFESTFPTGEELSN